MLTWYPRPRSHHRTHRPEKAFLCERWQRHRTFRPNLTTQTEVHVGENHGCWIIRHIDIHDGKNRFDKNTDITGCVMFLWVSTPPPI